MKYSLLVSLGLLFGCTSSLPIDGAWSLALKLQDKELPVLIYLKQSKDKKSLSGHMVNGGEQLDLAGIINSDGQFEVEIAAHYAKLTGNFTGNTIEGNWIRTNKENYSVPFKGVRSSDESLFKSYERITTPLKISGKWKLDLGEGKEGLGNFTQTGSRVQGSILTNTGDYRYLDGFISKNQLKLYGFDGVFSFVLEGVLGKEQFAAIIFSGKDSSKKVLGVRDSIFKLADPLTLTQKVGDKPMSLKMKSIDGELININAGKFKNKVKIIQVFGSWCPNCHDETNYFLKWRSENKDILDEVKFIAVSFEQSESKEEALKNLKKVRAKLKMDYDVIMADFDKTVKVTDVLPLDKSVAFPTTIFLDRDNKIVKIHTGFAGQATGEYFKAFQFEFDSTIKSLLL